MFMEFEEGQIVTWTSGAGSGKTKSGETISLELSMEDWNPSVMVMELKKAIKANVISKEKIFNFAQHKAEQFRKAATE